MNPSEKQDKTPLPVAHDSPNTPPLADPATRSLVVYEARHEEFEQGDVWNADYGLMRVPANWEFLSRGGAFITRFVKRGPHWLLKGRFNRTGRYRPTLGVYAPAQTIREAVAAAEQTQAARKEKQAKAAVVRERAEDRYRAEFEQACLAFLAFGKKHAKLAARIARETAARACQKYSGRVGRTRKIDLAAKVELAVRACIRHKYTRYERNVPPVPDPLFDDDYRTARQIAHAHVDEFLARHRESGE